MRNLRRVAELFIIKYHRGSECHRDTRDSDGRLAERPSRRVKSGRILFSSSSSPVPSAAVQFFILFSTAREQRGVSARAVCMQAEAE